MGGRPWQGFLEEPEAWNELTEALDSHHDWCGWSVVDPTEAFQYLPAWL